MSELLFTHVKVFDGSGSAPFDADVRVRGERIVELSPPGATAGDARVIDGGGGTLMPGLIEAHAHFDFGCSVGRIPANALQLPPGERMLCAVFAARTLLDHGYTSAYSAGSFKDARADVALKGEIDAGHIPGPRMKSCAPQWMPALAVPGSTAPFGIIDRERRVLDRASARDHVKAMADAGVEVIKLGLNGESGLIHGTTRTPLFHEEELDAAMDAVREAGLEASAHAYTDEAVRMALRHGVRTLYHCSLMEPPTIDLVAAQRDRVFVAPGPGILWATMHDGASFGMSPETIEKMEAAATLAATRELMPRLRERGVRVLPGGDYGFPWNPVGRNARDLSLFVSEYGFEPAEVLRAATALGAELMGMDGELGQVKAGYLADLLLVDGDPTRDIGLLQDSHRLKVVMKGGHMHKFQLQADAAS
jgi:imidazolonepropionase-like amidohydrolase